MIEFKENVEENLPYNRRQYVSLEKWYGISFQLPGVFEGKGVGVEEYLAAYEGWFKKVVSMFNTGAPWIVNHDFIDEDWFPTNENNLLLLRTLFNENNIPNTFKGALILTRDDLFKLTRDLITYPFVIFNKKGMLYDNLDISHSKYQLVIKVSAHMCIDVLSTNKDFLRKVVTDSNFLDYFKVIEYQGTIL